MEARRICWNAALGLCLVVIVAAVSSWAVGTALISHGHGLAITAYIDCLEKVALAKRAGRVPSDMPSGSEICEKYKR